MYTNNGLAQVSEEKFSSLKSWQAGRCNSVQSCQHSSVTFLVSAVHQVNRRQVILRPGYEEPRCGAYDDVCRPFGHRGMLHLARTCTCNTHAHAHAHAHAHEHAHGHKHAHTRRSECFWGGHSHSWQSFTDFSLAQHLRARCDFKVQETRVRTHLF